MKSKIKAPSAPKSNVIVAPQVKLEDERVLFSFSYFLPDEADGLNANGRATEYFLALLRRLRDVGQMKVSYFRTCSASNYGALRAHPIDWNHKKIIRKSFGIPQRQDLDENGWQFSLSKSANGRVHGFLIGRIFHVVWLDPDHGLYPWD